MVRRIAAAQPIEIAGPAGKLEAIVELPEDSPTAIAVVCHPHPLQQGTMHNKVASTVARAFCRLGAAAVRFNFRGVGASAGAFADGFGERDDALAVVRWSRQRWPGLALYLGGFSFGAVVALMATSEAEPAGIVTVAPPVNRLAPEFLPPTCPWLLVQGAADEVVDADAVVAWAKSQRPSPELVVLDGVGHFFHGQLNPLAERVNAFFEPGFGHRAT